MSSTITSPEYHRGLSDGRNGKAPDMTKYGNGDTDYADGYEDGVAEWDYYDGDR